jgi:asparagine synthase (glutamine-hydrolysing)
MSLQFGRWNFDGRACDQDDLARISASLSAYGHYRNSWFEKDGVSFCYCAFHSNRESRSEAQPYLLGSGGVLTWDGRLDNREELIAALGAGLTPDVPDVAIVAAACERWGQSSFPKLLGDWAMAIWNPALHTLVLAKDFLGARHLYYHVTEHQVTWSTLLDPLLDQRATLLLEEEYIAGWFASFPATHLSPFRGIHSVPPSSFVALRGRHANTHLYWDFNPGKEIRYRTDSGYEEHFRTVFSEAVRRRLRSDSPVAAELSGGMDSSAIVCVADKLIAEGIADPPRFDTLSYFDDFEANWNERPYFETVEKKRGRTGFRIDLSQCKSFPMAAAAKPFLATPSSLLHQTELSEQVDRFVTSSAIRVILSGLGGDELLGGVPTPIPGLADLLRQCKILELARQLTAWALSERKPVPQLLVQTIQAFLPGSLSGGGRNDRPPGWLEPAFVARNSRALHGYFERLRFCGSRPSVQANLHAMEALRRQIYCYNSLNPHYERSFPYLDRSLWEFVVAIPRDQLLRPGERRSLMRRALAGIVPDEILKRRRKAFSSRRPFVTVLSEWSSRKDKNETLVSSSLGIVNARAFTEALERARGGLETSGLLFLRTLLVERWLEHLEDRAVITCTNRERASTQCAWHARERTVGT